MAEEYGGPGRLAIRAQTAEGEHKAIVGSEINIPVKFQAKGTGGGR
jgi:hypothetical protein